MAQQFSFYQDAKCTIWLRSHFTVEAESYEQAVEKLRELAHRDLTEVSVDELSDGGDGGESEGSSGSSESNESGERAKRCGWLRFDDSQTLFDTSEQLYPEDNGDRPTLEIFDDDDRLIADNAKTAE